MTALASDESAEPVETYLFLIPVEDCRINRPFHSDVTWRDFRYGVAEAMNIPVKELKLAYRFTTTPQREAPQVLSCKDQIRQMFTEASSAKLQFDNSKKKIRGRLSK